MNTRTHQSATVGLARHIVLQAWQSAAPVTGAYMVATECGATLYPRHWNTGLAVTIAPRAEIDCQACRINTAECADDSCRTRLLSDGTCPACD